MPKLTGGVKWEFVSAKWFRNTDGELCIQLEPVIWIVAGYANLRQLFWLAIKRHVGCGFYEATQRLSCNCTSAELTQFDGRARSDDVMGNLTVSKWRASQVTVGMLAYRRCADS